MTAVKLVTHSSLWFVDLDSMMVTRVPRTEANHHPYLPYEKVGAPRSFTKVERCSHPGGDFYRFTTNEPRGTGFYWFETGNVIEGELPLEEM